MRILVATVPLTGHVQPMVPIASELALRGHEVRWMTGRKFAETVARTGAAFEPMHAARDWDDADADAAFPRLRGKRGLARVKLQVAEMFLDPMPAQLADLEAIRTRFAPDCVVADSAHLGAGLLAERHGIPWVGVGISALMAPSIDTAPFGSAQPPDRGGPGIHRFLNWLVFRVVFGATNRRYRAARVAAGFPAGTRMYFEAMASDLFLQPTIAAFEYPRRDLPEQVRFIGPLLPARPNVPLPSWWGDLRADRPTILVTQGTLATNPDELIRPALAALAGEDVLVVATGRELGEAPANARVAPFIPYSDLLPHCAAMITNGGYGGVQMALAAGVPLVVAGGSEEKPEIAARVAWSGAGVDLRTGRPRPKALLRAVKKVLGDPQYRTRAQALAAEMAQHDAAREAAQLIEGLVPGVDHRIEHRDLTRARARATP